jgi:hypothetical protein
VARVVFGNIFENKGPSWKFVDCGWNISARDLFPNRKCCGLGPWSMDRVSGRFTVDQGHDHGGELTEAPIPGRLRPWGPDARWGKGRGRYGDSISPITEAWEVMRGRHTGGDASAKDGNGAGTVGNRRRRVGGVVCFTGVGTPFYRVEARRGAGVPSMAGVEGASMPPDLKASVIGEMKREGAVSWGK